MLVALIVGAARAAVQHSSDPVEILSEVNAQLCERHEASATCLILRIDGDGGVLLANAGHLPPYLNGSEVRMDGALPIGLVREADPSTISFSLVKGDSLILMSDGVVEAQDENGTLFGFDRIDAMLRRQASAQEIAETAQAYGQEDDILVLQVTRNADGVGTAPVESQMATR
jgi:serine phosphatase RsbU (regulator of sigma subunit)